MGRYNFEDKDGTIYDLTDKTFSIPSDDFETEVDTIERSAGPGAVFPGEQRDVSKERSFTFQLFYNNETSFRAELNNRIYQFRKAVKIIDTINEYETEMLYQSMNVGYLQGTQQLFANIDVTFKQLKPYWESVAETVVSDTSVSDVTLVTNNAGFIDSPPIVKLTALEAVTKFSIRMSNTSNGIVIQDLQFGVGTLTEYIINNKTGKVTLNNIPRNSKIQNGTGPFTIAVGSNDIEFLSDGLCNIEITYKKRFYI